MAYAYRIDGKKKVRLKDIDADEDGGLSKEKGEKRLQSLSAQVAELDDLLDYAGQHALLIVLQGRDTSGKDGTIRHLLTCINAQSARVETFKVPTAEEMGHDFLWRAHKKTPAKGELVIFNRSHYEDVIVVRVHGLAPEAVVKQRYQHINAFERLLHDADTIVLKFFLHISKQEQEKRLLEREQETEKAWKLSVGDWKERELWDEYTEAYEDALGRCSSSEAPWFVVPANRKWYRNLAITEQVVEALAPRKNGWLRSLAALGKDAKKELAAYRAKRRGKK